MKVRCFECGNDIEVEVIKYVKGEEGMKAWGETDSEVIWVRPCDSCNKQAFTDGYYDGAYY